MAFFFNWVVIVSIACIISGLIGAISCEIVGVSWWVGIVERCHTGIFVYTYMHIASKTIGKRKVVSLKILYC